MRRFAAFSAIVMSLAAGTGSANAQTYGTHSANPMAGNQVNPYAVPGSVNLYDQQGNFAGNTSQNTFDADSVNNQFGRYASCNQSKEAKAAHKDLEALSSAAKALGNGTGSGKLANDLQKTA